MKGACLSLFPVVSFIYHLPILHTSLGAMTVTVRYLFVFSL